MLTRVITSIPNDHKVADNWHKPVLLQHIIKSPTASINPITANPVKVYTLPYWCKPPVLIFDIRALWHSLLHARVPECQKSKLVAYTSMAMNASDSNNLEQLALKGLTDNEPQGSMHTKYMPATQ